MKRIYVYVLVLGWIFGSAPLDLGAQKNPESLPPSFRASLGPFFSAQSLRAQRLARIDRARLQQEDERHPGTRFAAPVAANFSLENSGVWTELPNGGRVWRLQLQAPDALGLIALYDQFYLPPGAALYMYSADRSIVHGPYTSLDNNPEGNFVTGMIPGASSIIEYFEPAAVRGLGRLHIFRVDQAYHRANLKASGFDISGTLNNELGFGAADSCHANINCPEGADYSREKRAVCRILLVVQEGTGYCTGALMNNTRNDGQPLLISAFHCQDGYIPLYNFWRFDFNYESIGCGNPQTEPSFNSIIGCRQLAGQRSTDFLLLELSRPVPGSFNAYFLGWNRSNLAPSSGAIIHHPRGDLKKLALEDDGVSIFRDSIIWNNQVTTPPNHHFRARYDFGSFDVGSSGAPLLNQDKHFVGQLHGGSASCTGSTAYFGRLNIAWEGGDGALTQLKNWLDPLNLSVFMWDGMENPANSSGEISGIVLTETGAGISSAEVKLMAQGGFSATALTDSTGRYTLKNIPFGTALEVSVAKTDAASNGLSVLDLIRVQKQILNVELMPSPYQWIAADVNASRSISTLDLIQIRKIILGVDAQFANVPDWIFLPADTEFPMAPNPFLGTTPFLPLYQISNFLSNIPDLDFIGVKAGDANGSANPHSGK